jgi:Cof subfamily protein (haloacid dehalogenase superfamily)
MKYSQALILFLLQQQVHSFLHCSKHKKRLYAAFNQPMDDFGFPIQNSDVQSSKSKTPPTKADLYSNDELQDLLNLHNQVKDTTSKKKEDEYPVSASMHEAVLAALRVIDSNSENSAASEIFASQALYPVTNKMRNVLPNIRMIASDVDGTLLTSQHSLHPRTARAIERAFAAIKDPASRLDHFILATGKSRMGALNSLGGKSKELLSQAPGVFIQGLYCVDATGAIVYEKRLESSVVQAAIELAAIFGTSLFCYDGDYIRASSSSLQAHITEFHVQWGEPEPQRVDDNQSLVSYAKGFHKLLLMDSDTDKIRLIRPRLEELAANSGCVVTQAIDTMLELLPPDSSKAIGVEKLCQALGVQQQELLSIGDGENDVEFLRNAAFSVAVGNAVPMAKQAADLVLTETNNDGGAGIAIELFLEYE